MIDKEILKQIKGTGKIERYAVDTSAIRRGKANLALMMTLTTADHYDWFIGKFSSHTFFEYGGYRVYRRNVSRPPLSIPQADIDKLNELERKLNALEKKFLYGNALGPCEYQKDLVGSVHRLTPLMLACASSLSRERMHCIGEICDVNDELLPDMDLVKLYSMVNHYADEEEAIERIHSEFDIPGETFVPVKIDERTHWGMVSCPEGKFFSRCNEEQLIVFKDQQCVLGEVEVNTGAKKLTPHTQWVKSVHEYRGADITIPFAKPYPLWNLPAIQQSSNRVVLLTDNLYLAYLQQKKIEDDIQQLVDKEWKQYDRPTLYERKNDWDGDFERTLRDEVKRRTQAEYEQMLEQLSDDNKYFLNFNRLSAQDISLLAARLLYIYTPEFGGPPYEYSSVRDKGRLSNLIHVCNMVMSSIANNPQSPSAIYSAVGSLQFKNVTSKEMPSTEYIESNLGPKVTNYLSAVYETLCTVIENWKEEDRIHYEKIKSRLRREQAFCWSSWFGGGEAVTDVNWRELRKRDVVYVLTDEKEELYRTTLKVYLRAKGICNHIRFAVKDELKEAEEFLELAQRKWNLSPENIEPTEPSASMFETFDPAAELPRRPEVILDPIISERSITLMYAPTGVGKTWFAMCIALAASHGEGLFCNCSTSWSAPKPRRVVYIDSEMSEYNFKKRLQMLNKMYHSECRNLSFKLVADENINLADEESGYCDQITQWLNDEAEAGRPVDLLVLDNLSTLSGFNDSAKAWNNLFTWMKTLKEKRRHPCSVLVIHHSNKKGDQRGTSAKTATVDNVIKLEHQAPKTENSLAFEVSIEKGRDIETIPPPFTVELQLPARGNAKPVFRAISVGKDEKSRTEEALLYLAGEKIPPHDVIATLTGLSAGYIRQLNHKRKNKK